MVDGRIFVTTPWSKVYAFDAKTGKQLWKYDPKVPRELAATSLCCNISNRGVAYWNGKVIWGTLDGRLVAVDAKKGTKVWESQTTDPQLALSITGAPRIGNGLVFIGQAGAEFHQRGYMSAWDAETGKKLWHWWVVPGNPANGFEQPELEWAAKTWNGDWWKTGGGGTPWDGILYDPRDGPRDLRHRQWRALAGRGALARRRRQPVHRVDRRAGCEDRQVHAGTTRRYRMDSFDFDNTSPLTIADLVIDGQKKHVVMQAPKNGVFYVIEAATGKVISANLFVPFANWLTGFDKDNNWKPILNPDANIGKTGKGWHIVPFQTHVWNPQAFNPDTGLMYVPTRYASYGMVSEAGAKMGNQLLSINVAKRPETRRPKLEGGGRLPAGLGSGEAEGSLEDPRGQRQRRHDDHGGQPGVPGHGTAQLQRLPCRYGREGVDRGRPGRHHRRFDQLPAGWQAVRGGCRRPVGPAAAAGRACWSIRWTARPRCRRSAPGASPYSIRRPSLAPMRSWHGARSCTRRTAPSAMKAARAWAVSRTCATRRCCRTARCSRPS